MKSATLAQEPLHIFVERYHTYILYSTPPHKIKYRISLNQDEQNVVAILHKISPDLFEKTMLFLKEILLNGQIVTPYVMKRYAHHTVNNLELPDTKETQNILEQALYNMLLRFGVLNILDRLDILKKAI